MDLHELIKNTEKGQQSIIIPADLLKLVPEEVKITDVSSLEPLKNLQSYKRDVLGSCANLQYNTQTLIRTRSLFGISYPKYLVLDFTLAAHKTTWINLKEHRKLVLVWINAWQYAMDEITGTYRRSCWVRLAGRNEESALVTRNIIL